jgi:hypothetical protein
MEAGDFFFAYIFLGIAAIAGIVYLFHIVKAGNLIDKADEAFRQGLDKEAVTLYKKAIGHGNEGQETLILTKLEKIFGNHNVQVDFTDYRKLIDQTRILSKKWSKKSEKETIKIAALKDEIISALPEL